MTACMYITHDMETGGRIDHAPIILADSIATKANRSTHPVLVPANLPEDVPIDINEIDNLSRVKLYRKLYIFDRRIALAFAGRGDVIAACVKFVRKKIKKIINATRPMLPIQNWANKYEGYIWVVGGAPMGINGAVNRMIPPTNAYKIPGLGLCHATGSGAEDMIRIAVQFSKMFNWKHYPGTPGEMLAADMNAFRLAEESAGYAGGWGGYIESAYMDLVKWEWKRGPSALHLFMSAKMSDGRIELSLLDRIVAYDPGKSIGRILSARRGSDVTHEFFLEHILDVTPGKLTKKSEFWREWNPKLVTVAVLFPTDEGETGILTHILVGDSLAHLSFSLCGSVSVDLSPEIFAHLRAFVSAHLMEGRGNPGGLP